MEREACFLCQNVARYKCPKCEKTAFCSPEHGRLHLQDELSDCFPYTVREGRVVAARDLRRGEVVMLDTPLMLGPCGGVSGEEITPCVLCRAHVDLDTCDTCPGCSWPVCDTCASRPDPCHAGECSLLATMATISDDYSFVLVARLLLLKFQNPRLYRVLMSSRRTDPRCSIVSSAVRESLMRTVQQRLNDYWSSQEVISAFEAVETRSRVLRPGLCGLYESERLLNMGLTCTMCQNCTAVLSESDKTTVMVITTRDVTSGQHLNISSRVEEEAVDKVKCIHCDNFIRRSDRIES